MTHTLDSIMALAKECSHKLANEANWHALRLAVSEVLAERDSLKQSSETYFAERNSARDAYMRHRTLAEKAEAECERRNQLLGEARSYLIYAGWADLVSRIDAAIKEQP